MSKQNNTNKSFLDKIGEVKIDPNKEGSQIIDLGDGDKMTVNVRPPIEYYLIYKVITHLYAPFAGTPNVEVKEFRGTDIRESKRNAEAYYIEKTEAIKSGSSYTPEYPQAYDPEKGFGYGVELAVSELGRDREFSIDHVYKSTYTLNDNLRELLEAEAKKLIDMFEDAQDKDNKARAEGRL